MTTWSPGRSSRNDLMRGMSSSLGFWVTQPDRRGQGIENHDDRIKPRRIMTSVVFYPMDSERFGRVDPSVRVRIIFPDPNPSLEVDKV